MAIFAKFSPIIYVAMAIFAKFCPIIYVAMAIFVKFCPIIYAATLNSSVAQLPAICGR